MRNPEFIWIGVFCALLSGVPAFAQEVSPAVHHDVSGPLQVSAYADWTHVVPEYNENNNSASLTVYP